MLLILHVRSFPAFTGHFVGRSLDFLNSLTFPRGEGGLVRFGSFLVGPGKRRTLCKFFLEKTHGGADGSLTVPVALVAAYR